MRKSETNPIRDKGKIEEKSTSTMIEGKESNKKSGPMSPSKNDQNNTVNKTDSISKDTIGSKQDSLTSNNNLMKKMTIVDPKEESTNKISSSKDPLDKLKKEDLIIKIKEYEEKLKQEKEEKKKLIETKNKELENKDKVIFSVGGTNKKLLIELEELKKDWKDNKWNIAPELRANDEYWLPVGNILEEYAGALDTVWKLRLRNIYCSGAISSEEKKN
jgi:hypothetical protein